MAVKIGKFMSAPGVVKITTSGSGWQSTIEVINDPPGGWGYRVGASLRPKPGRWRFQLIADPTLGLSFLRQNDSTAQVGTSTDLVIEMKTTETIVVGQATGGVAGATAYILITPL